MTKEIIIITLFFFINEFQTNKREYTVQQYENVYLKLKNKNYDTIKKIKLIINVNKYILHIL